MRTPNLIFLIPLFCLGTLLHAQTYRWAKSVGGTGTDLSYSVAVDKQGNVYTTGSFQNTVDFDPGPSKTNLISVGKTDIFISKSDFNGTLIWAKRIGGTGDEVGRSIAVDTDGNIYLTGMFSDTVDFDPGTGSFKLISAGSVDGFIVKLDSNGNFRWAKSIGGKQNDGFFSVAVDTQGNAYTTGIFTDTVNLDLGAGAFNLISSGGSDAFLFKLDPNGTILFMKNFGSIFSERPTCLVVDKHKNIFMSGYFFGTTDFDPGTGVYNLTSNGDQDMFIAKLDSGGNLLWARHFGGKDMDNCASIAVDDLGNVYSTGSFVGTVDFDPGPGVSNLVSAGGGYDTFIAKLDSNGDYTWAKRFGGPGPGVDDSGTGIAVDALGNVYTTGFFSSTVDFDPGPDSMKFSTTGFADIFISKLDPAGNYLFAKTIGGASNDEGISIAVDDKQRVYITGDFSGTVDFNPDAGVFNMVSAGSRDIFTVKLIPPCSNTTSTLSVTECVRYKTPSGKYIVVSSGTLSDTILNASGCDSIITLNVTIKKVNVSVTVNGSTIQSLAQNAAYQWLSWNNGFTPITGATGQSFTPTVNGYYAVEVTENGCKDTSSSREVWAAGVRESTFDTDLKVYPNPTNGIVSVDFGVTQRSIDLSIVDVHGKVVGRRHFVNSSVLKLKIEGASGVYFLNITSGSNVATLQVIKQ